MDNTHKLVKFIITNPPGCEAAGFTIANKKNAKKEKKEKKEKKKEKKKKEKGSDDDDDEDDDAKDDKAKAKKGDDDDEDLGYTDELIVESTKRLAKFVKEQETKGKLGKDKFYDEARMIQVQQAYSTKLRMYVALQSLFDADMNKDGVKSRLPHIKMLATTPKMDAGDILAAFELYYVTSP